MQLAIYFKRFTRCCVMGLLWAAFDSLGSSEKQHPIFLHHLQVRFLLTIKYADKDVSPSNGSLVELITSISFKVASDSGQMYNISAKE